MHPPIPFQTNTSLSDLSTFGIGGCARYFVEVRQIEEMQAVLSYCHAESLPFIVIGKGSNCLFDDLGFDGLVILNKITFCEFDWPLVHVGAGYSFSLLGAQTARAGWAGLEFASGIPGSVGGAVFMNAGANGVETEGALVEVGFINERGELQLLSRAQLEFGYRHSSFQKMAGGAIVSAKFKLTPSEEARKKQLGIIDYRTRTQPYKDRSAGCVFRNPTAHSAGALIQQCGLKGMRIGDAEVSLMHANFIVNRDKAKAQDVLELAQAVKQSVKEKTGIDLEMEIRYIPYHLKES